MKRTAMIALSGLAFLLAGCETVSVQPLAPEEISLSRATTTTTQFSTNFLATAMCSPDIGRIRFSGVIEGVDHTTVDGRGETHRTRQFRVKGLDGTNLDYSVTYRVIGGAEMLTWNSQLGQIPGVAAKSNHAGTLVFDPIGDGTKVVAHHAIRFIQNANGEQVVDFNEWRCQAQN